MAMLSFYTHCCIQFADISFRTSLFLLVTDIDLSLSHFVMSLVGFGKSLISLIKQVRVCSLFPFSLK